MDKSTTIDDLPAKFVYGIVKFAEHKIEKGDTEEIALAAIEAFLMGPKFLYTWLANNGYSWDNWMGGWLLKEESHG